MRTLIALAVACMATAACVRTATNPATGEVDVDVESPTKTGERWEASIVPQSGTNVTGQASADVVEGRTTVSVHLTGAPAGVQLPWHIHEGTCGSGGPIVGSPSAYPVISVGATGEGHGSAVLDARLDESKNYYVNIHAAPTAMGTIVACGNLAD